MRSVPGTITDPAATRALFDAPSPTGAELLALAEALAPVVHAGQSRKGTGEPYVNHVRRVASRVTGWRAKTVALLHDVIEDTPITAEALINLGFPPTIVLDVVSLSKVPGESYVDFISRTLDTGSDDALRVKLSDLQDNLSDPWVTQTSLAERYLPAAARVTAELDHRGR